MMGRVLPAAVVLVLAAGMAAAPGAAQPYRIDPEATSVVFRARHMGVLTVDGRFTGVTGTVVYDGHALEATVTVPAARVDTGHALRDRSLRSAAFLDAARYPRITFTSTRIVTGPGGLRAEGRLDLHGVRRAVAIPFTLTRGDDGLRIEAAFTLNRRDYGLVFGSAMDALVGDAVQVTVVLVAR